MRPPGTGVLCPSQSSPPPRSLRHTSINQRHSSYPPHLPGLRAKISALPPRTPRRTRAAMLWGGSSRSQKRSTRPTHLEERHAAARASHALCARRSTPAHMIARVYALLSTLTERAQSLGFWRECAARHASSCFRIQASAAIPLHAASCQPHIGRLQLCLLRARPSKTGRGARHVCAPDTIGFEPLHAAAVPECPAARP